MAIDPKTLDVPTLQFVLAYLKGERECYETDRYGEHDAGPKQTIFLNGVNWGWRDTMARLIEWAENTVNVRENRSSIDRLRRLATTNRILEYVKTAHPTATVDLEASLDGGFVWFDIACDDKHVVVEWNAATGFGISALIADPNPMHGYGERPNESFDSIEDAQRRIAELLAVEKAIAA